MAGVVPRKIPPLFGDGEYQQIRSRMNHGGLISFKTLNSWQALCALFAQQAEVCKSFHERITRWEPNHPQTKRFKECCDTAYKYLQEPATDRLDSVLANVFRLQMIANTHRMLEKLEAANATYQMVLGEIPTLWPKGSSWEAAKELYSANAQLYKDFYVGEYAYWYPADSVQAEVKCLCKELLDCVRFGDKADFERKLAALYTHIKEPEKPDSKAS